MNMTTITIPVRLDTGTFRRFAVFDTLKRQKRWKSPAVFSGILLVSAVICFAMNSRADQAMLIGSVLMIIAVGLPAVYFGMFFRSLDAQAKANKLNAARLVYTVKLTGEEDGILVTSAKGECNTAAFSWKTVFAVYRDADCIYLYVSDHQAFLIPDEQADVSPDELWEFLGAHVSAEQMHDCRKN